MPVTGLDLPVKLRRALGQGKVVPAEDLVAQMNPYDGDGDGALTREELAKYLFDHRVGGPWFCQMMSHNVFGTAETRWSMEVGSIKIVAIARIINYTMARAAKPVKRYILTPEAVLGLEPKKGLDGKDPTVPTESLIRGGGGAPRRPPPRGRARGRPGGRATGRPPPRGRPRGGARPSGRSGPRGPRRPGKPRA